MTTRLPDFIVPGAQKAATTTLYEILKQHPGIFLPEVKEPHFFDNDAYFEKGPDAYATHFLKAKKNQRIGDITPAYLYFKEAPDRILKTLGEKVQFIFILRNPVDRAYSHYMHSRWMGHVAEKGFEQAIHAEQRFENSSDYDRKRVYSFLNRGRYYEQVKRYLDLFPREQMLFLLFETDIVTHLEATIKKTLHFLNVEPIPLNVVKENNPSVLPRYYRINRLLYSKNGLSTAIEKLGWVPNFDLLKDNFLFAKKPERLSKETKKKLFEENFREDVEKLSALINMDFSIWMPE